MNRRNPWLKWHVILITTWSKSVFRFTWTRQCVTGGPGWCTATHAEWDLTESVIRKTDSGRFCRHEALVARRDPGRLRGCYRMLQVERLLPRLILQWLPTILLLLQYLSYCSRIAHNATNLTVLIGRFPCSVFGGSALNQTAWKTRDFILHAAYLPQSRPKIILTIRILRKCLKNIWIK